jgi:hypothetical protein
MLLLVHHRDLLVWLALSRVDLLHQLHHRQMILSDKELYLLHHQVVLREGYNLLRYHQFLTAGFHLRIVEILLQILRYDSRCLVTLYLLQYL